MLQISRKDVDPNPFPHVIKDGILAPDLFAALRADFPDESVFADQQRQHGAKGSRTGSGFDIYRGDPSFKALTERSAAWREFADFINSERMADTFREVFADHLDDIGLKVDIRASHVDSDHLEPRDRLTDTESFGEKLARSVNSVVQPLRGLQPTDLFSRLDIHKGTGGYAKAPHCDRPNRLFSLIIYFSDAEATHLQGGDLLVFENKRPTPIDKCDRHPNPEDVREVARLRPKPNLGVFFPCQNNSYHGVTEVVSQGIARDFLYIALSGRTPSIW